MRYTTSTGDEYLDIDSKYIDNPYNNITRGSIVSGTAIEVLLREMFNAIKLSGNTPSDEDLTQLYQAIVDRDYTWSDTKNYRNKTLTVGSNGRLYLFLKPSGPNITDKNGNTVGFKDPTYASSSMYWDEFTIFKDNGINDLAKEVTKLNNRLNNIEPLISDIVTTNVQPLVDMHTETGAATNTQFGHVKSGKGINIDNGKISIKYHENIILNNDKLSIDSQKIVPKIANSSVAGVISVGSGLSVTIDGLISNTIHSNSNGSVIGIGNAQKYGHARVTDDLEDPSSAMQGVGISPSAAFVMYRELLGIIEPVTITTSRTYTVPATGIYTITAVGGGGNGAGGGNASSSVCSYPFFFGNGSSYRTYYKYNIATGGGGGGGGAGETITTTIQLTKGQQIAVTIGGSGGGTTTFGALVTARGGGNGSGGSSASTGSASGNDCSDDGYSNNGYGGAGGVNYGTGGSGGSNGISNPTSGSNNFNCAGGSGGSGGRSIQGEYGHGGNGGNGGGNSGSSSSSYTAGYIYGPAGGSSGVQGAVIIKPKTS